MTKSSQKRSRSEEEDTEDIFPRTKRREYNYNSKGFHDGVGEDHADGATEPHHAQMASTSTSPSQGQHATSAPHPCSTSPLAGSTASQCLPLSGADITATLQNTHLDQNRTLRHQPQVHPSALPPIHQLEGKDAGVLLSMHHPSLGLLPDVVHETPEEYYGRINRLLRSAHFEKLKRINEPSQLDINGSGIPE